MNRIWIIATLAFTAACERMSAAPARVDEHKLRLVLENISTARGWAYTGTTAERLAWLDQNAAWDVEGTVKLLEAARELEANREPGESIEEILRSGVGELEDVTSEMIGSRILGLAKRLGSGRCTVTAAPAGEAERARRRLTATPPPPAGLSGDLIRRIDRLRARAARVGPFFHVSCEGPKPILFGWIDDHPVPLFDLLEE